MVLWPCACRFSRVVGGSLDCGQKRDDSDWSAERMEKEAMDCDAKLSSDAMISFCAMILVLLLGAVLRGSGGGTNGRKRHAEGRHARAVTRFWKTS